MITYVLDENHFPNEKPNERYARVVNSKSFTESDVADAIAKRQVGISKAEALATLEITYEIIREWIAGGYSINMRTAHYHFSIQGTFAEGEHPTDAILKITPSKELAAAVKENQLRHVEPVIQLRIDYVEDVRSGTTNQFITRGGNVKIFGHNIKIAGDEGKVYVEFVSQEDPEAIYPVPITDIVINHPSELLIVAPHMVIDEPIRLRIRTQYSGNSKHLLKTPRSVVFEKTLFVKG
jgi:hypothetical protein